MPERIAYVIVSYRTARLARACQDSILSRRPRAPALVVHADGPECFGRPALGYSEALNYGIRSLPSAAEIICCLNADSEMIEDDGPVLDLFDADSELAIVGPRQVDGLDRIAHGGIVPFDDGTEWDLDLRHRCWLWPADAPDREELTRGTFEVPAVPGSVLYARRSALEELGGWPEFTSFYYEDAFLSFAARHRGWRVLYTGDVTWRHYGEGSPIGREERERRMESARLGFIEECRRAGIPLRVPAESAA